MPYLSVVWAIIECSVDGVWLGINPIDPPESVVQREPIGPTPSLHLAHHEHHAPSLTWHAAWLYACIAFLHLQTPHPCITVCILCCRFSTLNSAIQIFLKYLCISTEYIILEIYIQEVFGLWTSPSYIILYIWMDCNKVYYLKNTN